MSLCLHTCLWSRPITGKKQEKLSHNYFLTLARIQTSSKRVLPATKTASSKVLQTKNLFKVLNSNFFSKSVDITPAHRTPPYTAYRYPSHMWTWDPVETHAVGRNTAPAGSWVVHGLLHMGTPTAALAECSLHRDRTLHSHLTDCNLPWIWFWTVWLWLGYFLFPRWQRELGHPDDARSPFCAVPSSSDLCPCCRRTGMLGWRFCPRTLLILWDGVLFQVELQFAQEDRYTENKLVPVEVCLYRSFHHYA